MFVCVGSVDELVLHGLRALRDTLPNEVELTTKARSFDLFAVFRFFTFSMILCQPKMHCVSFNYKDMQLRRF